MEFWRQMGILNPNQHLTFPITIIGCGGIGSPTALALAKMGCPNITIYDDDLVEDHNIPNQLHKLSTVGKAKVKAVANMIKEFTGTKLKTKESAIIGERGSLEGVVVSGVDSMESREAIWKTVKYDQKIKLYVDARMGAEVCRIFTVNPTLPTDIERYEKNLYSDDKTIEAPCTERSIIYNVFVIAGLIANQIKKFAKQEDLEKEIILDLVSLTLITS